MSERRSLWWAALLGVTAVGCFDGRDALGLPCEEDFQCGNGQVCSPQGVCAWPGDLEGTGGATDSGSSVSGSSTTMNGPGTETTSSTGDESATEGSSDSSSGSSTGDPDPIPTCVEGAELMARDITVTGSGNAMSVGVGAFSDDGANDVVVLTRSPARLSLFRLDGSFGLVDDFVTEPEPMDIAVADIDADGFDDVVVVDANQTAPDLVVYWGDASSPLTETTAFDEALPIPHSVDAGQMLAGPTLEILVSSGTDQSAADLFDVDGRVVNERFSFPGVSASPWDTVIVDLNGEGTDEALVVGSNDKGLDGFAGSDRVHVLGASSAAGIFRLQELMAGVSPFGVDASDLDGDDIPEVVVVGKNIPVPAETVEKSDQPSEIGLCSRESFDDPLECEVWQPSAAATGFNNVRLADLNCDDAVDAIIGTSGLPGKTDGNVLLAIGPLQPDFVPTPLVPGGVASVGNELAIADATGDGSLDVLVPIYGEEGSASGLVRVYSFEEPAR